MRDWLGIALMAIGCGMLISGLRRRRPQTRGPETADAVGSLTFLALLAVTVKVALTYTLVDGSRFFSPLDLGGLVFVLAAYGFWMLPQAWLFSAAKRAIPPPVAQMPPPPDSRLRHIASADE